MCGSPWTIREGITQLEEEGWVGVTRGCTAFWQPATYQPTRPSCSVVQIENQNSFVSFSDWIAGSRPLVCLLEYSGVLGADWVPTSVRVSANPRLLPIYSQCTIYIQIHIHTYTHSAQYTDTHIYSQCTIYTIYTPIYTTYTIYSIIYSYILIVHQRHISPILDSTIAIVHHFPPVLVLIKLFSNSDQAREQPHSSLEKINLTFCFFCHFFSIFLHQSHSSSIKRQRPSLWCYFWSLFSHFVNLFPLYGHFTVQKLHIAIAGGKRFNCYRFKSNVGKTLEL